LQPPFSGSRLVARGAGAMICNWGRRRPLCKVHGRRLRTPRAPVLISHYHPIVSWLAPRLYGAPISSSALALAPSRPRITLLRADREPPWSGSECRNWRRTSPSLFACSSSQPRFPYGAPDCLNAIVAVDAQPVERPWPPSLPARHNVLEQPRAGSVEHGRSKEPCGGRHAGQCASCNGGDRRKGRHRRSSLHALVS